MDILKKERLEKWKSVHPSDISSVMELNPVENTEFTALVAAKIPEFKSAANVLEFVESNGKEFEELGRAGRLRFLAWVLAQKYNDIRDFMIALKSGNNKEDGSEEDEGEKSSGEGVKGAAPFFYSDLIAFAEALGPRFAAQIVDAQTLDIVTGASLEVANDMEMKGQI